MFPILCVFYNINLSKLVSYRKCEMIHQRKLLPDPVSSHQELRLLSCFPGSHTGARGSQHHVSFFLRNVPILHLNHHTNDLNAC